MYQTLLQFPQQFNKSIQITHQLDLKALTQNKYRRLVYAGMGGSALAADVFKNLYGEKIPITIVRDYHLPNNISTSDLVICASFSGNTEETLSCFNKAISNKYHLIAMSHTGQLRDLALQKNVPFLQIPECIQPRCALGYFYASLHTLLFKLNLISISPNVLENVAPFLENQQASLEKMGQSLAEISTHALPLIYAPETLKAIARIWKIKLNENAKTPSFFNIIPELNHNEMSGFDNVHNPFAMIYLHAQTQHPRVTARINVMQKLFGDRFSQFDVKIDAPDHLCENFAMLLIGDYYSYHLAKVYNTDPTPVPLIESFKKMLG